MKEMTSTPSALSQYARVLKPKKAKSKALPQGGMRISDIKIDPKHVSKYADVCGFNFDGQTVPGVYPHMLAFPLHMELMIQDDFPFPVLGLVHLSNQIKQIKPININDRLTIECSFDELADHDKGKIITIISQGFVNGELVWEDRSAMLKRMATDTKAPKQNKAPAAALEGEKEMWTLASKLGREYASISGDRNPIHLYPLTAKLFGFPRHIVHGMWTKARAVAALQANLPDAWQVDVEFKLPLFLPATVGFVQQKTDNGFTFEVRDKNGVKPHLAGSITAL